MTTGLVIVGLFVVVGGTWSVLWDLHRIHRDLAYLSAWAAAVTVALPPQVADRVSHMLVPVPRRPADDAPPGGSP